MIRLFPLTLAALCLTAPASAQIPSFQHIIIVIQENRSPDNFFQGLCTPTITNPTSCSTAPSGQQQQYNIQTANTGWADKTSKTGFTTPRSTPFGIGYDPDHSHQSFVQMCDVNSSTGVCAMDGAAAVGCIPHAWKCPPKRAYGYVDNSHGVLDPYWLSSRPMVGETIFSRPNRGPASRGINTCLERHRLRRRMTTTKAFSQRGTLDIALFPDVLPRHQRQCP